MNKITDIRAFQEKSLNSLGRIVEDLNSLPSIRQKDLDVKNTVLVNIDMVNGFAKKGALYSPRIEAIIPYLKGLTKQFNDYFKIFFADTHNKESIEFQSYPEHCVSGTGENEIIEELKPYLKKKALLVEKNSTNGFFAQGFAEWLINNPQYTQFVVVGDCSDICILNFCLTLKNFFCQWNIPSRIIIPIKGIETYDLDATNHNADLMNVFALYNMKMNGIELVADIIK